MRWYSCFSLEVSGLGWGDKRKQPSTTHMDGQQQFSWLGGTSHYLPVSLAQQQVWLYRRLSILIFSPRSLLLSFLSGRLQRLTLIVKSWEKPDVLFPKRSVLLLPFSESQVVVIWTLRTTICRRSLILQWPSLFGLISGNLSDHVLNSRRLTRQKETEGEKCFIIALNAIIHQELEL